MRHRLGGGSVCLIIIIRVCTVQFVVLFKWASEPEAGHCHQLRPYQVDVTTSRPLGEGKQRRACLLSRCRTAWEASVMFFSFVVRTANFLFCSDAVFCVRLLVTSTYMFTGITAAQRREKMPSVSIFFSYERHQRVLLIMPWPSRCRPLHLTVRRFPVGNGILLQRGVRADRASRGVLGHRTHRRA